jgi:hypothetical protein
MSDETNSNVHRPSPNRKLPLVSWWDKPRGDAAVIGGSVETDCGFDEEDTKSSLVTAGSSVLTGSDPEQEVVQKQATIPSGWTRAKFETDCQLSVPHCKDRPCHCQWPRADTNR